MPRGQHWNSVGVALVLIGFSLRVACGQTTAVPGDTNCDQQVDAADIAAVVAIIFGGASTCPGADVNGDGRITVADITGVELSLPPPLPTATSTESPTATATPSATSSPTPTL